MQLGLLGPAFEDVVSERDLTATSDAIRESELWGIGDSETYARKKIKRVKKTLAFVRAPLSPIALKSATTLLAPSATVMSTFFAEACWGTTSKGVMDFINLDRNPAVKVIQRYFAALADMSSDYWTVTVDIEGWDEVRIGYASTEHLRMIGGLYIRMVKHFIKTNPWVLLSLNSVSAARQQEVADSLFHCAVEHLERGVAQLLRKVYDSPAELIADKGMLCDLERSGFACPNNNIADEDRFARQNCYNNVNR